ncbi:MAG TPA: ATP-binding protein [Gemmataceae bacterium]
MTLTARLSWFFLTTLAAVLMTFSAVLEFLADRHLHRQLDDRLESAGRTLAAAVEIEPDGVEWEPTGRPLALRPTSFGNELQWVVSTEAGFVIDRSTAANAEELLAATEPAFRTGHRNPRRLDLSSGPWQVMRLRLAPESLPPGGVGKGKYPAVVIIVAAPLGSVHSALRSLAAALITLTATILVAALFAWRWICRRALAPVVDMAIASRAISATNPAKRLPIPNSTDELADLGRAFNDLLDRLGEAYQRESQFAGEASHQLRTPLAALIGQVEVALRRERPAGEYRQALEVALAQAGRLQRVVEALLYLARSEGEAGSIACESIELTQWTANRLLEWGRHPRAADLRFEPAGQNIHAAFQPDLFGELFDALLDNALKYSRPGTEVTVRNGEEPSGIWIEIEDRGCGIADEDMPHLFRPFFRAEFARKQAIVGSGLGLAVAARIAMAHGGTIEVASRPGEGSRFRIRLPRPPA